VWSKRSQKRTDDGADHDISEVIELAAQGRRMAIYDRATGLYAYWYVQLRAEEEVARAKRGGRPFACLSLWASGPVRIEALAVHLRTKLRLYDMPAYLNNGHFVVLLLETDEAGTHIVLDRIAASVERDLAAGCASHPDDGGTFEVLLAAAKTRAVPLLDDEQNTLLTHVEPPKDSAERSAG